MQYEALLKIGLQKFFFIKPLLVFLPKSKSEILKIRF